MKLLTRLALSQVLPLGVVGAALVMALGATVQVTAQIGELSDNLASIRQDQTLHRSAWDLEVALRQGSERCAQGVVDSEVSEAIEGRTVVLERALEQAQTPRPTLLAIARRYRDFARQTLSQGVCRRGTGFEALGPKLQLDKELTEAWMGEAATLHAAMEEHEVEARRRSAMATGAAGGAVVLAALALTLAARALARSVTEPLRQLASSARQIGGGDFSSEVSTAGPDEVLALARELDRMRRRLGELDQLKQGFLASVSHELRTPLTKLREALALLGDGATGPLSDRQKRVVKIGRDACEREIRMVSTLLELSRLQAGSPLQKRDGVRLEDVVSAAVEDERGEASARGVTVELTSAGPVAPLSLDAPLLERAVANLVRNAASVSTGGQVVRVRLELLAAGPDGQPGGWAQVVVSDQGPGVAPELSEQLFTPFLAHDVKGVTRPAGVGLGLALSRASVRAHGGDLRLDQGAGPGATFVLSIPVPDALTSAPPGA